VARLPLPTPHPTPPRALASWQASFHVFGMELLATLDLAATNDFFNTFFRLPDFYWRGFLASQLSAGQLIAFALVTFTLAPFSIKYKLIEHLVTGESRGTCMCMFMWCLVVACCLPGTVPWLAGCGCAGQLAERAWRAV
jgi:hypothetical protein